MLIIGETTKESVKAFYVLHRVRCKALKITQGPAGCEPHKIKLEYCIPVEVALMLMTQVESLLETVEPATESRGDDRMVTSMTRVDDDSRWRR